MIPILCNTALKETSRAFLLAENFYQQLQWCKSCTGTFKLNGLIQLGHRQIMYSIFKIIILIIIKIG